MLKQILVTLSLVGAVSLIAAPSVSSASGLQVFNHPHARFVDNTDPASADQSVMGGSNQDAASDDKNSANSDDENSAMSPNSDNKSDSNSDDSADNSSY